MTGRKNRAVMVAALFAGTGLGHAVPAMAQDTQTAGEAGSPDIVVTAQRREERIVDVPISISAIGARDIERRGVTSLDSLQTSVPGLRLVDIGIGTQRIQLRGISQFLGLPTVGNYIDEFSINNFSAAGVSDIRLLDMERVEVLRGPQPTLYGEGSMGGTIRYVTASPDLARIGGSAEAQINTIDGGEAGYRAEAVLNLPLVEDKVGIRFAAAREQVGGYVDVPAGNDVNDARYTTLRGKLLVKPSDGFSLSLLIQHQVASQMYKNYSERDYDSDALVASPLRQSYTLGNLVATYDFGAVTLLSSTGYLRNRSRSVDDSGEYYNTFVFGAPVLTSAIGESVARLSKFSQEVRLTTNATGPFRLATGVVYARGRTDSDLSGGSDPAIPGLDYVITGPQVSKSWAVYGDLSYDVTDAVKVEIGGRYFHDRRTSDTVLQIPSLGITSPTVQSGSFNSFNPRASISIKTSADGTIYANAAKGFRSGGFNTVTSPLTPPTYGPEKLWSYEIGTKQALFDRRMFLEISVYYNDYKGVQAVFPQSATISATTNSGKASGPGVDVTLQGKLRSDLSVSASVGYNHLRFDTTGIDRRKGEPLDMVPDWTWSAAIDYEPLIGSDTRLLAHLDYGYSDAARITLHSAVLDQVSFTQSRAILNARLGVDLGRLKPYVFANNLTNTARIVNPAFGAYFEPVYTRPRTIGAGVRVQF
ncbi:TonB-dependent receptor [Sphingomonas colocasiae]|uniref:TonB-dependent receptor n=1 Tax=Sphingomonas colocasiae TaxID=1848973 RepID=A0ABS7PQA8_9SPHN|nr:TonB-dependent receptor [Sphingomonas colocasiae]MBY8822617.1 TonB-dependent receptor [Sphingomonas colocasiae]